VWGEETPDGPWRLTPLGLLNTVLSTVCLELALVVDG